MDVELDYQEVWKQLQQSGWYNSTQIQPTSESRWRVQFPVAICPSCNAFIALRTIFGLDTRKSDQVKPRFRSSFLPLDFDRDMRKSWRTERLSIGSWSPQLYLYWMKFSLDGRFLFFLDHESPLELHLAVFQLDLTRRIQVTLVNLERLKSPPGILEMQYNKSTFNPKVHALAFILASSVFFWDFTRGKCLHVHKMPHAFD